MLLLAQILLWKPVSLLTRRYIFFFSAGDLLPFLRTSSFTEPLLLAFPFFLFFQVFRATSSRVPFSSHALRLRQTASFLSHCTKSVRCVLGSYLTTVVSWKKLTGDADKSMSSGAPLDESVERERQRSSTWGLVTSSPVSSRVRISEN